MIGRETVGFTRLYYLSLALAGDGRLVDEISLWGRGGGASRPGRVKPRESSWLRRLRLLLVVEVRLKSFLKSDDLKDKSLHINET